MVASPGTTLPLSAACRPRSTRKRNIPEVAPCVTPSTSYLFSAWVKTRELSTDQGVRFGLQSLSSSANSAVWTDDVKGTQPWTQIEFPWTAGNDVRELHLCVTRLPSAKFDRKIHGSAWIDDVALVPKPAENAPR